MVVACEVQSQNIIEWDGVYELQLSDFQSSATRIGEEGSYHITIPATVDFSFYMTNAEFVFTKNFNSKVNSTFNRSSAVLICRDTVMAMDMVRFSRFDFDLVELYARKLRKALYEEKGAFSDLSFFKPVYDNIQTELSERRALAGTMTNYGQNRMHLAELHQEVLREIDTLPDFCKTCKPVKRKIK